VERRKGNTGLVKDRLYSRSAAVANCQGSLRHDAGPTTRPGQAPSILLPLTSAAAAGPRRTKRVWHLHPIPSAASASQTRSRGPGRATGATLTACWDGGQVPTASNEGDHGGLGGPSDLGCALGCAAPCGPQSTPSAFLTALPVHQHLPAARAAAIRPLQARCCCQHLAVLHLHLLLQEEMDAARIPWAWRDYCAHLLIPLNKCRRQNAYVPWACHHEKHVYEKCQYKVRLTWAGPWSACCLHCACLAPVFRVPGFKHTAA
jgi:hypothetical protein